MNGSQAISAGVASADDHHITILRRNELVVWDGVAFAAAVLQGQIIHCEVDSLQLASGHQQVARLTRAAGKQDRVEIGAQPAGRDIDAHVDAWTEHDPFGLHQREAPIEDALLHLEFRDSVAQQSADAIGLLEDGHQMTGSIELIRRGKASRAGSDHGDLFPGARSRQLRRDPAFRVRSIDDRHLDVLDRHRIVVDAQHAGAFARRRAETSCELREVVRRVETIDGRAPPIAVDEVVPVGNQVAERASLVAERDPAVHAAGALLHQIACRRRQIDLAPVVNPLFDRARWMLFSMDLDEPCRLTHVPGPNRFARPRLAPAVPSWPIPRAPSSFSPQEPAR